MLQQRLAQVPERLSFCSYTRDRFPARGLSAFLRVAVLLDLALPNKRIHKLHFPCAQRFGISHYALSGSKRVLPAQENNSLQLATARYQTLIS